MSKNDKEDSLKKVTVKHHRDQNGNHPHVILGDIDDKHISVGMSTSKMKGKNHPNYKLKVNVLDPNKPGYMRRQGTVDKRKNYTRELEGHMHEEDYAKAQEYGKRAKEKYLAKNQRKIAEDQTPQGHQPGNTAAAINNTLSKTNDKVKKKSDKKPLSDK